MVKDTQASRLYPTVTATTTGTTTTSSTATASTTATTTKWVTRDIAALDFLLGIPMERQGESVRTGWERQHDRPTPTGKWWERHVLHVNQNNGNNNSNPTKSAAGAVNVAVQAENVVFLERPLSNHMTAAAATSTRGGGRRLEGDTATKVEIPQAGLSKSTRQRNIARQAQMREWECQVVAQDVLSGRMFFSAKDNYPVSVFSVIKYEPKREEAARRRQKLEARGGGGTQFVVPARDWRGTSYRALLPRRVHHKKRNHYYQKQGFNRFFVDTSTNDRNENLDESADSSSSDEEDAYVPGFLDDPEMRQGRHRHVMIGDRVIGCVVSSTIQFVKPAELKADLNKQFRERFDGWEPPQSQHKYIGAKIIDGVYTLLDPNEGGGEEEVIRMPPSLTLSKIRSAKQRIMLAAIHDAHLEVSTVALAFVYFERLCLDCRVDKSNRRLSFAACLLLAAKINESKITLLVHSEDEERTGLRSLILPTKDASTIFASLLGFFTQDWGLSLKHLFSAEWGVFAALGFRLHATPSQVEFHFRRIMKVLGWNALAYLGHEMYTQWQDCLEAVEERQREHDTRREIRRDLKERNLLKLELQRQIQEKEWSSIQEEEEQREQDKDKGMHHRKPPTTKQHMGAMKLIHRLTSSLARPSSMERDLSVERLQVAGTSRMQEPTRRRQSLRSSSVAATVAAAAAASTNTGVNDANGGGDDPLSLTSHGSARRSILRTSSLPFLMGADESSQTNHTTTSPLTSPRVVMQQQQQHLAIDICDDDNGVGDHSGIGNTATTDHDEEDAIFYEE